MVDTDSKNSKTESADQRNEGINYQHVIKKSKGLYEMQMKHNISLQNKT